MSCALAIAQEYALQEPVKYRNHSAYDQPQQKTNTGWNETS